MSQQAIRVVGLSKQFRLPTRSARYHTLRDSLANAFAKPFRALRGDKTSLAEREAKTFWALREVSFEIGAGEVVGIIGRNGAGKSTLLKILSRITEPTAGYADIYGRVGSLLEVGTGFHPELSGRENVFLNGAILGMRRTEIERKFDAIVAFAEVEKFIDSAVKHYSSGMALRLAFAVAAFLEPEIMLVDEALAVGDAAFQRKCLGKMGEIAHQGRTVLFVSHNMAAVQALCQRGIVLRGGTVEIDAPIADAVSAYLQSLEESSVQSLLERTDRTGRGDIRLCGLEITTDTLASGQLITGRPARFVFHLTAMPVQPKCVFTIYDHLGQAVANFNSKSVSPCDDYDGREPQIVCQMEELLLKPGRYRINVGIQSHGVLQDHIEAAGVFEVYPGVVRGRPVSHVSNSGSVYLPHHWTLPSEE